ncbi:3',5'-bisphosphate nucleotidase [Coprinopsis marcescibilis]|uniref:3'(2'),5'-bisphosphate nucleotidase n=1 Tax=Coprinopsis marcescibilis TaxID=230819 RepID=A0A5C3L261_COPMA|nr:3',5'-bisphosphate nucleotidase [Coprinopsis marcescibilis]
MSSGSEGYPYSQEERVAIAAVTRACTLTSSVFETLVKNETLTKGDKSPVTVGDFAAQAVISAIIHAAFPHDPIVGEEDASDLRVESGRSMKDRIVALANDALTTPLVAGEDPAWNLGPGTTRTDEQILEAIDRGNYGGGNTGRMWTIDPIDGTKGFLRGEQYAVCVSFVVDSQVKVGVIGCPNLPVDPSEPSKGLGAIFSAVRGHGARQLSISNPTQGSIALRIPQISESEDLSFLESVEAAHSSHSFNDRVAALLNVQKPPTRMDSQAKYACLARGQGGAYLRMPTGVGYKEKIWDHAPGEVLVVEAGGIVTDSRGEPLNFGLGRTLGENYGVIAAAKSIHPKILAAVQKVQNDAKAKV